ncbi:MAG: archaetidylserine decarboxylase [Luminiphilus sp.]|jgi:phosphatidylserine decarboxylase|nr:archaetidylserine decarboxylase [Luminiphilus sp.]MDG1459952.1 archaetidylserine decarboxylase [Luminiphilus sp.]
MKFFAVLQSLLPQHHLSRAAGWLGHLQSPAWLKNALIKAFINSYGISLKDAEIEKPEEYVHFNAFFTRALKNDARPLAKSRFVMPADGELSQRGSIAEGAMIQAKGRYYTAMALLGGDSEAAEAFHHGSFATIYLSPRDYHRIHMPTTGTLRRTCYVPGDLFAVNKSTAQTVDQLFARNERLVCYFDTADGPLAVVLVGAIIVAGIETVWGGVEAPSPNDIRETIWSGDDAPTFAAGDEIGRFFLGSTVIVLASTTLDWAEQAGAAVRVKAKLAV